MLGCLDSLPFAPRRVLVAGVTGVGKSTLARRLSALWDLPYAELDALHHGPGWTVREEFADDVAVLAAGESILRWESKTHAQWRERMPAVTRDLPGLTVVELRSPREVRRWLAGPAAHLPG